MNNTNNKTRNRVIELNYLNKIIIILFFIGVSFSSKVYSQNPCPPCNTPPVFKMIVDPVSGGSFAISVRDCNGVTELISATYTGPGFGPGPLYLANLMQAMFDTDPSLMMIQIPASCYKWLPGGGGSEGSGGGPGTANLSYCAPGCCLFNRGGGGIVTNDNEPGYAIRCSLNGADFDCFNLCDTP